MRSDFLNNVPVPTLEEATGKIPFTLLNDYMFKVVLQKNKQVLKSLISACLNVKKETIYDVMCLNTVEPGKAIDEKTYILDIKVVFNDNTIVNFEMQVNDMKDWVDRSLAYLSRCYCNSFKGEDYTEIKTTYQIGFLNYTLFKGEPKFFSRYAMRELESGYLYSSKFNLFVIDLSRIDLATAADVESGLAYWAKIFKAKTWEELKMVAEMSKDEELEEASRILHEYNQHIEVIEQCIRRDEYVAHENYIKRQLEEKDRSLEEKDRSLEEKQKQLEAQARLIEQLQAELAKKNI